MRGTTKRKLLSLLVCSTVLLAGCGDGTGSGPDSSAAGPETTGLKGPPGTTASDANVSGEKVSTPGGTYTRISPSELRAMEEREDFPLVNVHIPFEGNIPGTDRSIPYDEIGQNLDKLPENKSAKIVLYCRSGSMSTEAARTLVERGYTNVWELEGGMNAWEAAGFELKERR